MAISKGEAYFIVTFLRALVNEADVLNTSISFLADAITESGGAPGPYLETARDQAFEAHLALYQALDQWRWATRVDTEDGRHDGQ